MKKRLIGYIQKRYNTNTIHAQYLLRVIGQKVLVHVVRIAILSVFLLGWEVAANHKWIDPFIFSSPSRVYQELLKQLAGNSLMDHIATTTREAVIGFGGGTSLGIIFAIILWWSKTVASICEPYLVVLNAMPKIILGPVFIVWFKTGSVAIIAMALAISLITTVMMVYNGFKVVDPEKIKLAKTFGASKVQILLKVVMPASFPTIISALKVNVGLSWVGVIVGEFLVSQSGLGYLAIYGGQVLNFSLVMMSTILILLEAVVMYVLVAWFEGWYIRRIQ